MYETLQAFVDLVEPRHLWMIFGVVLVYAATMSWILIYHWQEYGTGSKMIILAETIFVIVMTGLFLGLLSFIGLFSAL